MTSQSFTFIDPARNQAQYTVYEADRHNEYHWSTGQRIMAIVDLTVHSHKLRIEREQL